MNLHSISGVLERPCVVCDLQRCEYIDDTGRFWCRFCAKDHIENWKVIE